MVLASIQAPVVGRNALKLQHLYRLILAMILHPKLETPNRKMSAFFDTTYFPSFCKPDVQARGGAGEDFVGKSWNLPRTLDPKYLEFIKLDPKLQPCTTKSKP